MTPELLWRIVEPILFLCNLPHLGEHLTVNQGVTGSSPVGGVRERPYTYAPLAQLVEQLTLNQWVPCESKGHKERKRKGYKLPKSGVAGDAAPESNLREAVSITHL